MAVIANGRQCPSPRRLPDLVDDSEIQTTDLGNGAVRHQLLKPPTISEARFSVVEETWYRKSAVVPERVFIEECQQQGHKRRVAKVLDRGLDWAAEVEALAKFSGPKYAYCFVESGGWYKLDEDIVVTMEYLCLGNLGMNLLGPLPEIQGRDIVQQLLEGLMHMHDNGFVHRNLTLDNIMVASRNPTWIVKIGGFGCITRDPVNVMTGCSISRLSLKYSAPELLNLIDTNATDGRRRHHTTSTTSAAFAVDMWSLGAITFRLLTNAMPFDTKKKLQKYIAAGRDGFPRSKLISEPGRDFITDLMSPGPRRRPSAAVAAAHRWLQPPSSRRGGCATPPLTPSPPAPARHSFTPPEPEIKPSADDYNAGEKRFVRLRCVCVPGPDGTEPVIKYINPFSSAAGPADPLPSQRASQAPFPNLYRQRSTKRKSSRDPEKQQPPSLQKRPSLKKTDDYDEFFSATLKMPTTPSCYDSDIEASFGDTLTVDTRKNSPVPPRAGGPIAELMQIKTRFETEVQPLCEAFVTAAPTLVVKKEHARLIEALQLLLMAVDAVRRGENQAALALGKDLVKNMQFEADRLDKVLEFTEW